VHPRGAHKRGSTGSLYRLALQGKNTKNAFVDRIDAVGVGAIVLATSQQVPPSSEGVLVGLHGTIPPVTRHSEWVTTGRLDSGHMTHPRLPEPCLNVLDRMDNRVRGNVVTRVSEKEPSDEEVAHALSS
jgi:hypothetical protein